VIAAKSAGPAARYWQAKSYSALAYEAFLKLAELPDGPEIHEVRAEAHQLAGRHADAVQEWRAAVRLAPGDARVEAGLASALVTARDYGAARPLLERLLNQNPTSIDLNLQLGRVLVEQQSGEQALAYLSKAAGRLEARALLGRVLLQLGRPAEAIPHLLGALPDDTDGSLHYQLAMAYRRTGDEQRAKRAIEEQQKMIARTKGVPAENEITPP
jgi:predicted Zn-dependent protease